MIAIGCDHAGYPLKLEILNYLKENNFEYKDLGCDGDAYSLASWSFNSSKR